MNSKELFELAQKLSSQGMTDHLKNGKEAVSISLMLPKKISEKSRQIRKELLKQEFYNKLNDLIESNDLEVDFNSVSPTGQTIQAKLGIASILPFFFKINQRDVEVYPNTKTFLAE